MASQKRILKDLKEFTKEPITDCFVRVSEVDCHCWDAFVVLDLDGKRCPLHLAIRCPEDYPGTAPSAGFSCSDFGFTEDILGNFAKVHNEWADIAGSGWSPAYTISSLLCNVHVILTESTSKLPQKAKDTLYKECMDFFKTFDTSELTPPFDPRRMAAVVVEDDEKMPESLPPAQSQAELPASDFRPTAQEYLKITIENFSSKLAKFGEPPAQQVTEIASAIADRLGALLLWHDAAAGDVQAVARSLGEAGWNVRGRGAQEGGALSLAGLLKALAALRISLAVEEGEAALMGLPEPDSTIACWYSLEHYTETVLGVGIALERGKMHTTLSTDGALLSIGAFEGGLRQTPTKTAFEFFLPAFICPVHSTASLQSYGRDWEQAIVRSVALIGNAIKSSSECALEVGAGHIDLARLETSPLFASLVLRIYSDIINSLVVKMMQPTSDVRASERVFRVLIDCWRALYWFKQRFPCVHKAVVARVKTFVSNPAQRSKAVEPNIGCLLALRTVVSEAEVPMRSFFHGYLEESSLRSVMWWKKSRVPEEPRAVFEATAVSRRLFLFQSLFLTHSLTADLEDTAALADRTECKLTTRLAALLGHFKQEVALEEDRLRVGATGEALYSAYFEACNCPYQEATRDLGRWIRGQALHAAVTEGYFFSSTGGGERRGGGGRGGGIGGGRGGRGNRW